MFGQARLTVATDAVDSTSGRLRSGAQSIRGELDTLVSEVTGLTSTDWTGIAASAFSEQYALLNQGWVQVEAALDGIAGQLSGTATDYADTEQRIARSYRSV